MKVRSLTLDGKEYMLVPRDHWKAMTDRPSRSAGKLLNQPALMPDGNYGIEHVRISLANKIITRRKAAGLTQAQLAKRANVRVETISRLENGLHMPGARTFDKLDRALNRFAKPSAA
jgi:DNA-binding XRE family transcriptional regulator